MTQLTDREILEACARASCTHYNIEEDGIVLFGEPTPSGFRYWNPLEDDGDALRLAVRLNLLIQFNAKHVFVYDDKGAQLAFLGKKKDPCAATRRAIVQAAAAMAQREKEQTK